MLMIFVAIVASGFGFLVMVHSDGHMTNCAASTALGGNCPFEVGTLASIDFHLNALRGYSLSIFYNILWLIISGLALLFIFKVKRSVPELEISFSRDSKSHREVLPSCKISLRNFLSILEKRDPNN